MMENEQYCCGYFLRWYKSGWIVNKNSISRIYCIKQISHIHETIFILKFCPFSGKDILKTDYH